MDVVNCQTGKEVKELYETFTLKDAAGCGPITGYHWALENPEKVVVIIHGLGELAGRYDRMNGFLQKAGMAGLSMDLRGHGLSGGKRGHCAPRGEILGDIDRLIEKARELYPGVPIVFYGHSLGGNIGLDYRSRGALNQIPEAYVISAPWLLLVKPPSGALRTLVGLLSKLAPSLTIKSAIDEADLGHPDSVLPYKDHPLVHDKISMATAMESLRIGEALAAGSHPDNGGARDIPLLLMHGTEDKICSPEGSRRYYDTHREGCVFIPWEGLFHEIHNGNRVSRGDEVIERMVSWIRDPKGPR
jgi:alpha-beta hydrolase superfamily lysophospholipase